MTVSKCSRVTMAGIVKRQALPSPAMPNERVARGSTRQVGTSRHDVRQGRKHQAPFAETATPYQKRVKPCLEKRVHIDVAKGHPEHRQDAFRTRRKPPGETFRVRCCRRADLVKFRKADSSFFQKENHETRRTKRRPR